MQDILCNWILLKTSQNQKFQYSKDSTVAANYPFATIEPNVGIVMVPDKRMDFLVNMYEPKSVVPTSYEFIDIAGLVKGASSGEGLGNKFLSHIREVDSIVEVVRCFENENIVHVDGSVDPIRDIETINLELILADLETINKRMERAQKAFKADKKVKVEIDLLNKIKETLEVGKSARTLDLNEEELDLIKDSFLLTLKPILYIANVSEDQLGNDNDELVNKVKEYASKENANVIPLCVKIEEELSSLDGEDKKEMLEEGFKIWVIGLVLMAGSNVVINLFSPNKIAGNEEAIRSLITAAPYIMLFNTSILAPLIEEITFRKAFRDIIDTKWLFVIISGVVFGGLHVITSIRNAYDFLYLLPYCSLGIALSYMYAKTKNIFVSISMHALHNFLITFMNIIALGMIVLC